VSKQAAQTPKISSQDLLHSFTAVNTPIIIEDKPPAHEESTTPNPPPPPPPDTQQQEGKQTKPRV